MSYRDLLRSLGSATERKVMVAHAALTAGTIRTESEFISIVASIIAKANGSAVALADLSLAATLTLQLREPVAALGLLPPASDPERLAKGLGTILSSEQLDTAMQLGRLALRAAHNGRPLLLRGDQVLEARLRLDERDLGVVLRALRMVGP